MPSVDIASGLALDANGATLAVGKILADAEVEVPRSGTIAVWGTFGGTTLTIQFSPDGGTTWIAIPSAAFTADKVDDMTLRAGHVRAITTGGDGTTSVNVRWFF